MDGHEVTPRPDPAAVAHAMLEEVSEITQTRGPRVPPDGGGGRWMHWLVPMLSALVAAAVLLGALGRAFYVTRDEYTSSETANVVAHTKMTETLDRVDRSLAAQTQVMNDVSKALQAQAVELASMRAAARR